MRTGKHIFFLMLIFCIALAAMGQNFTNRYPVIDGWGGGLKCC